MRITILFLCFFLSAVTLAATAEDPFSAIERITLDNGMTVYLAPRPKSGLVSVHVEVDVGWEAEQKPNWGVSHLLEHVLFRDKQLQDEMSYLQLIKEAGGTANGETRDRETEYYGTIPPGKGIWLLDRFAKMILHPEITANYVEKEKATVELERGKPGPISSFFGFNPMDYLRFEYLSSSDFWTTEFGVNQKPSFTITQEQFSTRRLTAAQVQEHYTNYYYPKNMRLYVGGEFDRAEVLRNIKEKWASVPDRKGKTLPALEEAHLRNLPYERANETYENPTASLGIKVWGNDYADEVVLHSYMEYLAHRLMKEIRNKKGQTYSANASTAIWKRRMGYSIVSFQTQDSNFKDNIKIVKDFFDNEAKEGHFTDEQIRAAETLYLDDIRLSGKSAGSMVHLAQTENNTIDIYGAFSSPQKILSQMSNDDYRARLKKLFQNERRYQFLVEPPLFFAYDSQLLAALALILSFIFFRRALTKTFDHSAIRWVRKVRYPPLKIIEGLTLAVGVLVFYHIYWLFETATLSTPYIQGSLFFTEYVRSVADMFLIVLSLQGTLSLLPWKLMVVDDHLWLKSISYYSRTLPLKQVADVELIRFFSFKFLSKLWQVKWRFYYFNPLFWQKGMLITVINNGQRRAYFFGIKNASEAASELLKYQQAAKDDSHQSVAAA
jgi:zinc protease